jgi:hypothetical protein
MSRSRGILGVMPAKGSDLARWQPRNESDLEAAALAGVLDEGTGVLELKRQLNSGKSSNLELARDLASLAIEGGLLLVGVDEARDGEPARPNPVALDGLPERIEQVALTRCDPPLTVRTEVIPSRDDPAIGFVAISVPASAAAPHMVDGRYWGRGARTKRQLTDREVEHLHDRRRRLADDAAEHLDSFVQLDPIPDDDHGHLFLVGVPLGASPDLLVPLFSEAESWQRALHDFVRGSQKALAIGQSFAPDFPELGVQNTIPGGWALSTWPLDGAAPRANRALSVELDERGLVRVFCGRATDRRRPDDHYQLIFERLVTVMAIRTVLLAAAVANDTDFGGRWAFGIEITGIKDAMSWIAAERFLGGRSYRDDRYRRLTAADTTELDVEPRHVAERLVASLLRTMDVLDHPDISQLLRPSDL